MTIATIATILTPETREAGVLDAAIGLSSLLDAHLDISAMALTPPEAGPLYLGSEVNLIAAQLQSATQEREEIEAWLDERMKGEVVRWSRIGVTVPSMGLMAFLARHLRFADLTVLPRIARHGDTISTLIEGCLFGAGRPVLMVPPGARLPAGDGRVILAWNDGEEALAAARAALPLLTRARLVEICIIDPPPHAPDRSDPGGELAQFLQRHGAKAEISILARTETDIAHQLNRHAKERGAEMIVAGAYGKSRLREAVFGGTTRHLLTDAELPVLFAR